MPAPIKTPPVILLKNLALPSCNNQPEDFAPKYEYNSNQSSSNTEKVRANTRYWAINGSEVLINCGNNAVKKTIAFGLLAPTIKPLKYRDFLDTFANLFSLS